MPRPKGSKNKPKEAQPVEFNYEEEADQAYAAAMTPTAQTQQPVRVEFDYTEDEGAPMVAAVQAGAAPRPMFDTSANMFLINGRVRLDRAGQDPVVAEQQRLVYAHNFNEAVMKYTAYFTSLSNPNERYTVIGAGGSEAIR